MLSLQAAHGIRHCDGLTRREMLRLGGIGLGGLTLPGLLRLEAAAASTADTARPAKARSVIILFLSGGPSQLDMWDMKPDAPEEIRGTFRPIDTNVEGIQVSEHLPRMARLADKYSIIRSMRHRTTNHPAGAYWMMAGHAITRPTADAAFMSRIDRPHPGSVLTKLMGAAPGMPAFVMVPEAMNPNGPERAGQHAGFLGAAYDPYRINSDPNLPDYSPGALEPNREVPIARLEHRRELLRLIGDQARQLDQSSAARQFDPYYRTAFDLITSPAAQRACDISAESDATRDRYGRHVFGQSVLLARRMVEAGVRLVHVNWVRHDRGKGGQGYDSHRNHLAWSEQELLPPTDAAFSSLIEDLDQRGLLDETLVVMMGEFGRTPKFNENGGRDHWSACFSLVVAGGGIRGGQIYGASDKIAAYPITDATSPENLLATIYHCLGLDPATEIHDLQHRPYRLSEGTPIAALL